jgi:hypothetical protein
MRLYFKTFVVNSALGAVLALGVTGSATAAPVFYFDETAFNSALAALSTTGFDATVETFDDQTAGDKGSSFMGTSGISFSTATADTTLRVNQATAPSTSGFSALAQTYDGPLGGPFFEPLGFGTTVDIALGTSTHAFSSALVVGLNFEVLPQDLLVEVGTASSSITQGTGTAIDNFSAYRFIGVIDPTTAFSSVTMTFGQLSDSNDIGELDDVAYYTERMPDVPQIPLPGALPMLLAGLGALVALRRRT